MTEVEELRKPFEDAAEILAALKSARNEAARLRIVRHRIEQSKALLIETDLGLLVDVVTLIPHYTTDDWVPSDNFVEDFIEGKTEFNGDTIVGGPNHENANASELRDTDFGDADFQANWDALMQTLEIHKVEKRVWQLIRRSWLHDGTKYETIAKSRFWWLLGREAEIELLYRENPLKTVSGFFGKMFVGASVEIQSLSSPVPKSAKHELLKIAAIIRENLTNELSFKTRLLLNIALGQHNVISICSLVANNLSDQENLSWDKFAEII